MHTNIRNSAKKARKQHGFRSKPASHRPRKSPKMKERAVKRYRRRKRAKARA